MKKIILASSVRVTKDNKIAIRGYYQSDDKKITKNIPYNGDLMSLYNDIRLKNIIIHDTANNFKWYYILKNIFQLDTKEKKMELFQKLVEKYIISPKVNKYQKFKIRIFDNRFVYGSNRRQYFFTDDINEAKEYNLFQASYVYNFMKKTWGNEVAILAV